MVAHSAPAALSRTADGWRGAARALLVGSLVAIFARAFVVAAAIVPTSSMAPTLVAGDRVVVARMLYATGLPAAVERLLPVRAARSGDVVWLRSPIDPRVALVKRVVAVAGEPFAGHPVPIDRLAVVGDRRGDSLDSRQFGSVPREALRGRVVLVLWSADEARGWRSDRLLVTVR